MRNLLLAATAALSFAVPAAAAPTPTYNFSLTGSYTATWSLPASPTPYSSGVVSSDFNPVLFALPGNTTKFFLFTINSSAAGGGIDIVNPAAYPGGVYRGLGDEIYTGSLAAPTFKTGTFTLYDFGNVQNGSLTISDPSAGAVPEPASWAMLIAGFGLTGAAMRRRRTRVAAA